MVHMHCCRFFFFFQAEDGIRDKLVTGVQTCALPICRAEIYPGVATTANASYAVTTSDPGATSRTAAATAGVSLVPNRMLPLAADYGASATRSSGGGTPGSATTRQRAEASVTFAPVPALYASAGVTRAFGDRSPTTLAHFTLNLSPFAQGQLLARATYSDTIDTGADARTRLVSPSLRWAVRSGVFLDVAYADVRTEGAVEATRIQTASANLTISL